MVNSKIQFLFQKGFLFRFWPSSSAGLSGLLAQLDLLAQLGPATHPSPTSSQNQRHRRPDLVLPCLHRPGRHGRPSSQCQSSPPSFTPWPLHPPFKSCLNPSWWTQNYSTIEHHRISGRYLAFTALMPLPQPNKRTLLPDGTLPHHRLVPSSSLSSPRRHRFESEPCRQCATSSQLAKPQWAIPSCATWATDQLYAFCIEK
jgi:hypothetical protein